MLPKRLLLATPLLLLAKAALAAPRVSRVRFHLPGNETPVTSFRTSAPAIHLLGDMVDVTTGMRVNMVWIAVNTEGTPPGFQIIDQPFVISDRRMDVLTGRLTLNGNPWPPGDYRVDILINAAPAGSGTFRVTA